MAGGVLVVAVVRLKPDVRLAFVELLELRQDRVPETTQVQDRKDEGRETRFLERFPGKVRMGDECSNGNEDKDELIEDNALFVETFHVSLR